MKNLKTRVAAVTAILGLGGLSAVALSAGNQKAASVAAKPLVKTKVIHRTIRVTKHIKPKHPMAAGAGGATYASGEGSSDYGGSATTGASSTGSASYSSSSSPSPVTTASSGASTSVPTGPTP